MTLSEQGLKDGLRDLAAIRRILVERRRDAETTLARAEVEATELRKLESFASAQANALARQLAATTGEPATTKAEPL